MAKLRKALALTSEEADLAPSMSLVELGIDSLVAVEVRSWFLKELKIDIPTLKLISGAFIEDICQLAMKKLTAEAVPAGQAGVDMVAAQSLDASGTGQNTPVRASTPNGPLLGSSSASLTSTQESITKIGSTAGQTTPSTRSTPSVGRSKVQVDPPPWTVQQVVVRRVPISVG